MRRQSVPVGDIQIYPFVSVDEVLETIASEKKILIAVNAEKIIHASEEMKAIINENIGYADGAGAVMALKKKGYKNAVKIPGCELWLKIIEYYYLTKSFYFIGSKQNIIEKTVSKLKNEFPNINILNYHNGYFSDSERQQLFDDVRNKKPDVVFVAMGSPKQEVFMQEMMAVYPAVYQGLGGSFDVYTGNVERAPQWWIHHNLEWAFRLLRQPKRLFRQIYLILLIPFLFRLKTDK